MAKGKEHYSYMLCCLAAQRANDHIQDYDLFHYFTYRRMGKEKAYSLALDDSHSWRCNVAGY